MTATRRPKPPKDLPAEAVAEWKRALKTLEEKGRDAIDFALCELYARTWHAWKTAALEVAKNGAVADYHSGPAVSPQFKVMKESGRMLRGLLKDLGLTPPPAVATPEEEPEELEI